MVLNLQPVTMVFTKGYDKSDIITDRTNLLDYFYFIILNSHLEICHGTRITCVLQELDGIRIESWRLAKLLEEAKTWSVAPQ